MTSELRHGATLLVTVLTTCVACAAVNGAVSLLGVQYQQDDPYTEYLCYWHDANYPTGCGADVVGSNVHVYLKNDGASEVTIEDVYLEGYSLKTVIEQKMENDHKCYSIYYHWDNPPQAILDAGEPVWFRADPNPIPAGGVGQVVVRLRRVPTTNPIDIAVDTSANTLETSIDIDASAPVLASVGFSWDRTKAYLHWRRSNGTAPTTVKMDGANVTSGITTVNDADEDFAVSVIELDTALDAMTYHVYLSLIHI